MKKLITLLLSILLVFTFVACSSNSGQSTLKGSAEGFNGPINVTVTKEDDKIVSLEVAEHTETPEYGGDAITTLSEQILVNGSLDGVDAVSGATVTSKALFEAINSAK